jgi:hypothetical protein
MRRGGKRVAERDHDGGPPRDAPQRAVGAAKLTRSGASDVPRSPWCGKLTRAQSEDHVRPADALRYANWMLSAERGWAAVNRRATEDGAEPDLGALASAFAYLAEARATQRLPDELALHLGEAFGVEARGLRIHTDEAAAAAAALLHARAFTVGADLYFAAGAYDPTSESGVELIAHEVAHVAQHQRGLVQGAAGEVSRPSDSHEHQADELARRFLRERARRRSTEAPPPTAERDDLWGGQAPRRIEAATLRAPAAFAASGPAARAEEALAAAPLLRKPAPPTRKANVAAAPPLETVVDLLGKPTFEPTPEVASHLEKAGAAGAAVRVKLGSLSPVAILRVKKSKGRYITLEDQPQLVPLAHSLFVPVSGLVPVVRVQIGATHANAITGHAALEASPGSASALSRALGRHPEAIGLAGFELPHLVLENRLENGTLTLGARATTFELGGWVQGQLSFGLTNHITTFEATANIHARGLKDAELHLQRDAQGNVRGSAALSVHLGDKFTGAATASYADGDVQIKGELAYRSEKLTGALGLMVADVAQADQLIRAQLDPAGVLPIAGTGGTRDARPPQSAKGKKGERGIAGWGELDFAFTDWLVGKALVAYGPSGHLTVLGKIAPPRRLDLMRDPKRIMQPILPQTNVEASYGIPHLADIHVGIGVSLNATAELGPIYMTDLAVEGLYSTDPTVMNAFSITGDLRAQAHAGLALDVKGYAGLRVLKHSVNVGAGIQGEAGIRAHAEARPTLGYREVASPTAGKQGEYYLKGHLEMAAQPVLALGGRLFVELDSPWWSPAPDKTWEWPIGSLEYPLPTQLGVGADLDYVVGSGQWPDLKLSNPSFDPHQFVDTMMANRLPRKTSQAGDQVKQGTWQGVAPTKPTAPPPSVPRRAVAEPKAPTGAGPGKPRHGQQTPEEKKNVPKSADVAARWAAGMEALGELRKRSESDPETAIELQQHLAQLKARHGFTRLTAERAGDLWLVDAAMNPEKKDIPIQADPREKTTSKLDEGGGQEELKIKSLVEPRPATIEAEGALVADLAKATTGQVLVDRRVDAKTAVHQILREHKDARFDKTTGTLTLPAVVAPRPDAPLATVAADLAKQTGVSRITVAKDDDGITLRGEVNPWTPLAKVQSNIKGTAERLQLAEAVEEFHDEFAADQWMKHFGLGARQTRNDLKAAQEMEPARIIKTERGRYQLEESSWRKLKDDIVGRFKLTARREITVSTFAIEEIAMFCENDQKLPKERGEYRDNDKMTKVFDVLVREQVVRQTSRRRWEFTPVPAQRFLPAGWTGAEVRARYFENGSGFSNERARICSAVCAEVVAVISLYERAEDALSRGRAAEHDEIKRRADLQWDELRDNEKVSRDHRKFPADAASKAMYSSISTYHADHIEPLAWLWEHRGFNNVDHAKRLKKCGSAKNLRGMWGPDNCGKGARGPDGKIGEYMRMPWVGPLFTGPTDTGDMMDAGYGDQFRLCL